jgi:hypothetical protein
MKDAFIWASPPETVKLSMLEIKEYVEEKKIVKL